MIWDVSNSTVIISGLSAHAESLTARFSRDRESADRLLRALDALALATRQGQIVDAMDRFVVEGIHGPAMELFRAAVNVAMNAGTGADSESQFPNPYSNEVAKVVASTETDWKIVVRDARSLVYRIRDLGGITPGTHLSVLEQPEPESVPTQMGHGAMSGSQLFGPAGNIPDEREYTFERAVPSDQAPVPKPPRPLAENLSEIAAKPSPAQIDGARNPEDKPSDAVPEMKPAAPETPVPGETASSAVPFGEVEETDDNTFVLPQTGITTTARPTPGVTPGASRESSLTAELSGPSADHSVYSRLTPSDRRFDSAVAQPDEAPEATELPVLVPDAENGRPEAAASPLDASSSVVDRVEAISDGPIMVENIEKPSRFYLQGRVASIRSTAPGTRQEPAPPELVPEPALAPEPEALAELVPDGLPAPRAAIYARIECDAVMTAENAYALTVGLAPSQAPDVVGNVLQAPTGDAAESVVVVRVDLDGFETAAGEEGRLELAITALEPYPSAAIQLTPGTPEQPVEPRAIRVNYSADGQDIGFAVKPIAVLGRKAPTESGTAT